MFFMEWDKKAFHLHCVKKFKGKISFDFGDNLTIKRLNDLFKREGFKPKPFKIDASSVRIKPKDYVCCWGTLKEMYKFKNIEEAIIQAVKDELKEG